MSAPEWQDLEEGRIDVGDLGEPTPLPDELVQEIGRSDDEADDDAGAPEPGDRRVGIVSRAVGSLFRIAGTLGGIGLPEDLKRRVRAIWTLDAADATEIAVGLVPLLPERWLRSRTLGALGTAGGLLLLVVSVAKRADETARIRKDVIRGHATPIRPDPGPAADAGPRRPGARRGGDPQLAPVEPIADGAPGVPDGFTGAGLGVGPDERQ